MTAHSWGAAIQGNKSINAGRIEASRIVPAFENLVRLDEKRRKKWIV